MDIQGIIGLLCLITPPIAAIIIKRKKPDLYKKLGSFWGISWVGVMLLAGLFAGTDQLIEFFDGTNKIRDEKLLKLKLGVVTIISSVVYTICILLHRLYMRYVTFSLYLFFSASGVVMAGFFENINVKDRGYSGHRLRVAKWEHFKGSDDSQFSYLLWTLINPFIYGGIYFSFFYGIYIMIFDSL